MLERRRYENYFRFHVWYTALRRNFGWKKVTNVIFSTTNSSLRNAHERLEWKNFTRRARGFTVFRTASWWTQRKSLKIPANYAKFILKCVLHGIGSIKMKKQGFILTMLTMALVFVAVALVFSGCETANPDNGENSGGEPPVNRQFIDDGGSFNAKILGITETFVDDTTFLVEPLDGEAIRSIADRISFTIRTPGGIDVSVGDYVNIRYDGYMMKSYPVQIIVISWSKLPSNPGTGANIPNTDPKSINITGISDAATIVRVGVWVFTELPSILSLPLPVAVGYGYNTGGGSASLVDLTVPQDIALYDGPAWTGNGDYYVAVAIDRGPTVFYSDDEENPVKVAFDKAGITLEFIKFKAWSPQ